MCVGAGRRGLKTRGGGRRRAAAALETVVDGGDDEKGSLLDERTATAKTKGSADEDEAIV